METLPGDWLALAALVFLLGLKHGMDPDHLVTIDGMARFNALRRPRLSRWSGLLFSLGHGAVVTLVAVIVATVARDWQAPEWLELTGAGISILFMLALAVANLVAVVRAAPGEVVSTVGLKGRLVGSIVETSHPVVIASVGAAFALSFDTISQAMLFSIAGSSVAGWTFAVALGLVFTAGMVATDAVNGYAMSRLIARADRRAAVASRVMSLAVGAAFALSFDTISQAMLFSIAGSSVAGWTFAVVLGLVFTAGMAATDAVNGYTMSRLIARADRRAAVASRVMSLAVAALSLLVAGIALAKLHWTAVEESLDGLGLALGAAVIAAMIAAFALAMRAARAAPAAR